MKFLADVDTKQLCLSCLTIEKKLKISDEIKTNPIESSPGPY